jgi:hypothetical protein
MATITKADIIEIVEDFSQNIPDRLITPHINKAKDIDFETVLPKDLLTALFALDLTGEGQTELKVFYNNYFRICWVYRFYERFLSVHGTNVTTFGVTGVTNGDAIQVSPAERAQLVANINRDASVYFIKMSNRFKEVGYKFDNTTYTPDETYTGAKKTKKFFIKAIN